MNEQIVAKIVSAYGYECSQIATVQKGYRNESWRVNAGNEIVNVIIYKSEPGIVSRIKRANEIGTHLYEKGLPARYPLNRKILKLQQRSQARYAALYTYLPGSTIAWESYSMEHLKNLGQMHARIHTAMSDFDPTILHKTTSEYEAILNRAEHYFNYINVKRAIREKLGMSINSLNPFYEALQLCENLQNKQALHMDFVRGNVLFEHKTVSGIIDFEKASYGHPSLDIARTLAFLLVDCKYKTAKKVTKYYLHSGYIKRGNMTLTEHRLGNGDSLIETLISMFLMYDLYKFLLHNPYENLCQNEHFIRTKEFLLERKVITRLK